MLSLNSFSLMLNFSWLILATSSVVHRPRLYCFWCCSCWWLWSPNYLTLYLVHEMLISGTSLIIFLLSIALPSRQYLKNVAILARYKWNIFVDLSLGILQALMCSYEEVILYRVSVMPIWWGARHSSFQFANQFNIYLLIMAVCQALCLVLVI